ncbi:hypothetical protein SEA_PHRAPPUCCINO_60 [Mycobacterium phage Phrappuccino]|uniref:Uncharacterized protein n=1 Tax=Mycobacterium phage Phrappuccino TaxID=2591223 RepID=A0A514DDQ1_9CAUD|nr:hypothetical protein KHQ87_gp060 [Mycobacterium phage Phrappuccino]QDH91735.1 hypothetical protein SEA_PHRAPPUCCINO_60 [Mycobacterium phage Phrappuccino]QIQ63178.1 hypothetical protein SEA_SETTECANDELA_60 [Mycobacterium phage Settecandela]
MSTCFVRPQGDTMTTTTATPTPRTIAELRKHDGPIYMANNTANRVHCHEQLGDHRVDFELDPVGGEDSIQMVPKMALEVRGIQKMWRNGDLTVSTDESMEEQITLLIDRNIKTPQDRLNGIMAASGDGATLQVEGSANGKNLTEKACLECGAYDPKTGVLLRGRVVMRVSDVEEGVAPLCATHQHLSTQWAGRQVLADTDETPHWEFDKVSLTAPVREQG